MNVKIQNDKPMMADAEIEIIDDLIEKYKPEVCLEWGSGNSTLWYSQHDCIKSWLSLEHNGHYVEYLKGKLNPKTQVVWVADNEWYGDSVKLLGRRYDFILVDGRQREGCLSIAHDIIKPGGIILLHDSGREEYQEFIKLYKGIKLIDGEIPQGDYYAHRGLTAFTL